MTMGKGRIHYVLLSGGSGMRLWPLSNEIRSKQFLRIFKGEDGSYHSMVQRVYRQLLAADPAADVTVATSRRQVSALLNHLGEGVSICAEPCRRDTFPAIALAASFLHDQKGVSPEEPVVICPVDPFVEDDYFCAMKDLAMLPDDQCNMAVLGIHPTYPSEKYGYVIPVDDQPVSEVRSFREKPDKETAAQFIAQGALWNAGVFACRLSYLLGQAREQLGSDRYTELRNGYDRLPKISFDYAVAEKEPAIRILRYNGSWRDIGTWNTLTEAMEENVIGDATLSDSCENVHVVSDLDLPILCMGLKNMIVSASPDGILISDKEQSSYIKPYVDQIAGKVMFAEKSWGSFRVIDVEDGSLTIKVTLMAGHQMNYHSHAHREEIWNVISGEGCAIVDGRRRDVGPGDVVMLPVGSRHMITAHTDLQIIEVQLGQEISVEDKVKYPLPEGIL